jgi:hypothetical protein
MRFARELEGVSIRKSKNKEKLYQAGLQIKSVLNNLIDLIRGHIHTKKETLSLKSFKPLLENLHDKCDILEQLVIATLHPQRDQTLKVKCYKRKHNFEKFRKETRLMIQ